MICISVYIKAYYYIPIDVCITSLSRFGPSIEREHIDVLVVSEETRSGGELVQAKRVELGLNRCELVVIPLVDLDPRYVV